MAVQEIVEQTVIGLGYDLVEIERSAGGLLRITLDLPWAGLGAPEQFVTVEDCEKVTRQLQFALEVDGAEYKRLEVSSPGIDRPLKRQQDFQRFVGQVIDLTLKAPIGDAAAGAVNANRKKFRGVLEAVVQTAEQTAVQAVSQADAAEGIPGGKAVQWQITWREERTGLKPGQKVSHKRPPEPLQVMVFDLAELREARLAPIVNFRGRGNTALVENGE